MVRYKIVSVGSRRPYSSCRSFARRQAELSHYSEVGSREKKFRRTGPTFEHHAVRAAAIVSHFEFAPEGFNLAAAGADDLAFPRAPHSRCKLLVKPADAVIVERKAVNEIVPTPCGQLLLHSPSRHFSPTSFDSISVADLPRAAR